MLITLLLRFWEFMIIINKVWVLVIKFRVTSILGKVRKGLGILLYALVPSRLQVLVHNSHVLGVS